MFAVVAHLVVFMFFGHPGPRFSVRGCNKARDFYVFRASRVSTKHSRLSGTLVFLMFFCVQDLDEAFARKEKLVLSFRRRVQGWRV